jgi:membrane-associated protease RseP (regulator of RpoE activity)
MVAIPVHLLVAAAAGTMAGARVEEIAVFLGGSFPIRAANPRVRLGWFPGGWVRFAAPPDAPEADPLERLPRGVGCAVALAGPAAVLALSACLLGPVEAALTAAAVFEQILHGLDPQRVAAPLRAWEGLGASPVALAGVVLAKVAGFNLLPLPTLAGGHALLSLVRPPFATRVALTVVGTLGLLVLGAGWAVGAWWWYSGG